MQPVAEQILVFLMLVLLGHCIGVIYDLYRVIRRAHGLKKWGTNLGDAVFWIIVTAVTYLFLLEYIWGEVRIYVFIAMILGFYIYLKIFSLYVLDILFRLHCLLSRIIRLLVKMLCIPLKILAAVFIYPVRFLIFTCLFIWKGLKRIGKAILLAVEKIIYKKRPPQDPPSENLS